MDSYMDFEAPFSSIFFVSPRLADSAAPAAFCCALDFAGMVVSLRLAPTIGRSTYAFVLGSFYDAARHRPKWGEPPSVLSLYVVRGPGRGRVCQERLILGVAGKSK